MFERKWRTQRAKRKLELLKKYKIQKLKDLSKLPQHIKSNLKEYKEMMENHKLSLEEFTQEVKNDCLQSEERLMILEQIEYTKAMVSFENSIQSLYSSLVIQFGYILLFSIYFPLVICIVFLGNLINIQLTAKAYSKFIKRSPSRRMGRIGIWNTVLKGLTFFSIFYNTLVILFQKHHFDYLFDKDKSTILSEFLLVFVIGHILAAFSFILERTVPQIPKWLVNRLAKDKHREKSAREGEDRVHWQQVLDSSFEGSVQKREGARPRRSINRSDQPPGSIAGNSRKIKKGGRGQNSRPVIEEVSHPELGPGAIIQADPVIRKIRKSLNGSPASQRNFSRKMINQMIEDDKKNGGNPSKNYRSPQCPPSKFSDYVANLKPAESNNLSKFNLEVSNNVQRALKKSELISSSSSHSSSQSSSSSSSSIGGESRRHRISHLHQKFVPMSQLEQMMSSRKRRGSLRKSRKSNGFLFKRTRNKQLAFTKKRFMTIKGKEEVLGKNSHGDEVCIVLSDLEEKAENKSQKSGVEAIEEALKLNDDSKNVEIEVKDELLNPRHSYPSPLQKNHVLDSDRKPLWRMELSAIQEDCEADGSMMVDNNKNHNNQVSQSIPRASSFGPSSMINKKNKSFGKRKFTLN